MGWDIGNGILGMGYWEWDNGILGMGNWGWDIGDREFRVGALYETLPMFQTSDMISSQNSI